ncbi:carboxypeptidase-like regulatory domain-containing protein [Hymenobacter rubripertinctus]|uniref:Carboxypeptidase-like regulatory domain-containing protein n=1 Tax=Hymenobacter rubripertinctus TaxID=2029981 RepID=A0A418R929_9BACT|nr:carboxypeptidase-like regulatory domain-containing protein [Hymenobacter rubripertinctus]RIY13899.1 carboxypeptidase-like regulatory domain-containing protein [Hymenobacter rubripertinctus]
MIHRLLAALVLIGCSHFALAQNRLVQGQILNDQTGEPVPFATLGVPGRSIGTVADEQGRYLLRLPPDLGDTLVVTSVGFARTAVPPAALAGGQRVFRLRPQEQELLGVVVQRRPVHAALLGQSRAKGDVLWMGGSSGKETVDDEWGWELGTVLTPLRRTYLEEFHVFLADNNYQQLRFRLNLYALENGRPGKALLSQDIQLISTTKQRGWLSVDLRPYDLQLEGQPVVATIQWLQSETQDPWNKYFSIPVTRQKKQVMVERENSEAIWTIHAMQPSLYFTVMTE